MWGIYIIKWKQKHVPNANKWKMLQIFQYTEEQKAEKVMLSQDNKEYYKENVKIINQPIRCECGSIICKHNLQRHCKTNLHLELMNSKN